MEIARFVAWMFESAWLRERREKTEKLWKLIDEISLGEVFYETIGGMRRCVRWVPRRSSEDRLVASIGGLAKGIIAPDGTIAP